MSFGAWLREARAQAGVTLADVAGALGCSVSYVSDVEHGRRGPFDFRKLRVLAEAFGVPFAGVLEVASVTQGYVHVSGDEATVRRLARACAEVLRDP